MPVTSFIACDTPMNIAQIWNRVIRTIAAHAHTTQFTLPILPGMRLKASSPVSPLEMV